MARAPAEERPGASIDGAPRLGLALVAVCGLLVLATFLGGLRPSGTTPGGGGTASASPVASVDVTAFLDRAGRAAPPLALVDPDARPFTLASLQGGPVFVFFGYTHCPDVCPATIGTVGLAMRAFGADARALFVSIDPERDTTTWLKEYAPSMPAGFTPLTGTPAQVRTAADAWGVRYARVETGVADAYSMSHTADVFLVDAAGRLRARFPFGTEAAAMTATLRLVTTTAASTGPAPTAAPSPVATPSAPALGALRVEVVSSSVWAGGPSPVILALNGPAGRLNDTSVRPAVQLTATDGTAVGAPVEAVPVRPPGVDAVSYVALLEIPTPGSWRLAVSATPGVATLAGTADVTALDQGTSARIGSAAPTIHTPTLDDVAGDVRQLTTDPIPDLRLYGRSTTDALADHAPFVFVLDSAKFRVTTACGKALIMARYLRDRWPDVTFIHHEPFRYAVVTDTPVLDGTLAAPHLTAVADAWGIGGDPWGPRSMPWLFVVDGNGIVRAKYQGVMGSDDVDVIVALIAQGG
ncbi:MAG TPA: SCO family protein [Candidatus Limnocylindrales bacterium]